MRSRPWGEINSLGEDSLRHGRQALGAQRAASARHGEFVRPLRGHRGCHPDDHPAKRAPHLPHSTRDAAAPGRVGASRRTCHDARTPGGGDPADGAPGNRARGQAGAHGAAPHLRQPRARSENASADGRLLGRRRPCCRPGTSIEDWSRPAPPSTPSSSPGQRSRAGGCASPSATRASCPTPWARCAPVWRRLPSRGRFCPPEFTISQLREVYEAVWGTQLDAANFQRKVFAERGVRGAAREVEEADGAGRKAGEVVGGGEGWLWEVGEAVCWGVAGGGWGVGYGTTGDYLRQPGGAPGNRSAIERAGRSGDPGALDMLRKAAYTVYRSSITTRSRSVYGCAKSRRAACLRR